MGLQSTILTCTAAAFQEFLTEKCFRYFGFIVFTIFYIIRKVPDKLLPKHVMLFFYVK